ncbi:DUF2156 domain-containing protein [Wenxinia marina]|nr:DUF2156 domain-containing protein [Wenxinia marina]
MGRGPRAWARGMLPVGGLAAGLWLLAQAAAGVDLAALRAALAQVGAGQWAVAAAATAVSLWSMGHLDRVVHRWLGTGVAGPRARRAGMVGVAIGQTVGFGLVSGTLARWRALPGTDLATAGLVALGASLAFFGATALLFGLSRALTGGGALALSGALLLIAAAIRSGAAAATLSALWTSGLDTAMAALALWAVWHGSPGMSFPAFWGAYLVALWAGLVSQSPGGVGVFEATLLALVPGGATPEALAALVAYRAVYHLVPAALALLALIRPEPAPAEDALRPAEATAEPALLAVAPDTDWGLVRQGGRLLAGGGCRWHRREMAGQFLTLGRPLGPPDLPALKDAARREGLPLALYRLDARTAHRARGTGWAVVRVGAEARIDPTGWSADGPARRQLRRKLSAASRAGLAVTVRAPADGPLPAREMAEVHAAWRTVHGSERGLVMGRFDPALLAGQAVILGHLDGRLVAFASFHVTGAGWGLDLMRQRPDVPQGTMQALIVAAIAAAAADGAPVLTLATVPDPHHPLARRLTARTRAGLHQFKASFAPDWRPVYAAAPNRAELALGLARIALATRFPRPVRPRRPDQGSLTLRLGEFRFEFTPRPCDPVPRAAAVAAGPRTGG